MLRTAQLALKGSNLYKFKMLGIVEILRKKQLTWLHTWGIVEWYGFFKMDAF
jgi:hypothetical protein